MIKMIAGKTGVLVNGITVPKTKESDPFRSTLEHEARMVKAGLAVYVDDPAPVDAPENPTDGGEDVSLEDMKADDLRALGKEYGLSFKVGMKKAEMIEAIKAARAESDEDNEDENPTDGDEDGEEAPTFDPSEAVQ